VGEGRGKEGASTYIYGLLSVILGEVNLLQNEKFDGKGYPKGTKIDSRGEREPHGEAWS